MTDITSAGAKATAEINVGDLATLVANMSRLLAGLSSITPFEETGLGLAEWVVLSTVAETDGVGNKQLTRLLGVSGQRVNQILMSLTNGGLISVVQSPEDNTRNAIKITDSGKRQLIAVNSKLSAILPVALKGKERSLGVAGKHVRFLMRIVQAGNPEMRERQKKKVAE